MAKHSGVYVLKQTGNSVVSTSESDYRVEAKVYGAMIVGRDTVRLDRKQLQSHHSRRLSFLQRGYKLANNFHWSES